MHKTLLYTWIPVRHRDTSPPHVIVHAAVRCRNPQSEHTTATAHEARHRHCRNFLFIDERRLKLEFLKIEGICKKNNSLYLKLLFLLCTKCLPSLSALCFVVKYSRSHMNKEIFLLSACNSSSCCSLWGDFCRIPPVLLLLHLNGPVHQSY